ncbi:MAG: type II secretion system protein [Sulfurovum sp.]|nr:type II secretion system protein [Sulfurovaceae bacterium]
MKNAFTMIELVFVIVVAGILSTMIAPNFQGNNLRQAANQVVSHIRYTQHLAMMDNKFDVNDAVWYRKRWTIRFVKDLKFTNVTCPNETLENAWSYMIFENTTCDSTTCNTNPNKSEFARDSLDNNKFLSGGYNNILCVDNDDNEIDEKSSDKMRLAEEYGVTNIIFGGGCRSSTTYLNFDNMGRPFNSYPRYNSYAISSTGYPRLIINACTITLWQGTKSITINIKPETGYTYI